MLAQLKQGMNGKDAFLQAPSFDLISQINGLNDLLQEKSQGETRAQRARRVLGDDLKSLSDEEIEVCLTEFQYLLDAWLDEFEEKLFNKTLKELIREG